MTAKDRRPGDRYSREQRQEDRSEGQIKDRFAELGWPCDRLGRDLGEDLSVRIYDEGASAGLTFLVQLKSAADAEKLKRRKSPALRYDLEVKDLLHWEVSTTLVVLVIWDVTERRGWWRQITEIIGELDAANKGWRKKKKVAVSVPLANGTDDEGLRRLRWAVADHNLPIVPKPKETILSIGFATTEDGVDAFRAFERALDRGEAVTLVQGFVPMVELPAWQQRIYGTDHVGPVIKLEFKPTTSAESKAVRIEVDSPDGHAVVPYVELRAKVHGRKRLVLTNEHQAQALVFTIDLDDDRRAFTFSFASVRHGHSVYEAREVAGFLLAAGAPHSRIRILGVDDGQTMASFESSSATLSYDLGKMRRWRDVLDKLCFIQQRAASQGTIAQEALEKVTMVDVLLINRVFQILRDGKVSAIKTVSFSIAPEVEVPSVDRGVVLFRIGGAHTELLGLNIPLGDGRLSIVDSAGFMNRVREAHARAVAAGKTVMLQIEHVNMVEEYLDWLPGNLPWAAMYEILDRISAAASPMEGYFTRADARAAGASDAIFDALLAEHKIERIDSDVFRLVHFPRSDHEELVSLWLQTDRKGVLSHDTALLLHELSDILPMRRHVTVPPGWSPPEGRVLATDVVLHHADVPEDELSWIGPVPFTAPLRTVRDSIAVHVSPDLVEQAIADGLRRGMFRATDLPPGALPGAA